MNKENLRKFPRPCKYEKEGCNNIIKDKRWIICGSCRHKRRKNKSLDDVIKPCDIHGKLTENDVFKYDGKYKCKECKNIKRWRSRKHTYDERRIQGLKKFNMTIDQYNLMFNEQHGLCAICNQQETALVHKIKYPRIRKLAVDHCHVTNKIRGLLCLKCNSMIGSSKEDPTRLTNAVKYLEKHKIIAFT